MLQNIRRSQGMSQTQLAEKSGVSLRMIQHYEQGVKNIDRARIDTICALASALKCNLWEVLNDTELKSNVQKLTLSRQTEEC